MSFNTFVAALVGFGLFFAAIALSTDNFMVFVSGAGFILVVGGTLAATFISYEFRYVIKALSAIASTFKEINTTSVISMILLVRSLERLISSI